jgi:purine-nucleoside phosphorylase
VVGVSCITNFAAGIGDKPLSHEEVAHVAEQVTDRFTALLSAYLPEVARARRA